MKNKRKAKRILAGLLALQLVFFVGVGTYVQNVYAEETVKSQTEEKENPEKNAKNYLRFFSCSFFWLVSEFISDIRIPIQA